MTEDSEPKSVPSSSKPTTSEPIPPVVYGSATFRSHKAALEVIKAVLGSSDAQSSASTSSN